MGKEGGERQGKREVGISLVLPVYNEEENLEIAAAAITKALQRATLNYELVIVDDGSKDSTGKIADQLARKNRKIKVIHQENKGVGKALVAGFRAVTKELATHNSADLPFDTNELKNIVPMFKGTDAADFVVVVRKDRSANTLYRRITSWGNNFIIRLLFGVKIKDMNFVQVYRKKVLDSIKIEARDLFIPPEIVIKAMRKGFRVKQYATIFYPRQRGEAKYGKPKQIIATFKDQVRFWWKWKIRGKWDTGN